jgi:hypothetical protein
MDNSVSLWNFLIKLFLEILISNPWGSKIIHIANKIVLLLQVKCCYRR